MQAIKLKTHSDFCFNDCPIHGLFFEHENYATNMLIEIDIVRSYDDENLPITPSVLRFTDISNLEIDLNRGSEGKDYGMLSPIYIDSLFIQEIKNKRPQYTIDLVNDGKIICSAKAAELFYPDDFIVSQDGNEYLYSHERNEIMKKVRNIAFTGKMDSV